MKTIPDGPKGYPVIGSLLDLASPNRIDWLQSIVTEYGDVSKFKLITDDEEPEKVFQTFYFPVKDFQKINPNFNLSEMQYIKFIFDRNENGVVVFDNIGFMKSL